jgi:hypothetical protein
MPFGDTFAEFERVRSGRSILRSISPSHMPNSLYNEINFGSHVYGSEWFEPMN